MFTYWIVPTLDYKIMLCLCYTMYVQAAQIPYTFRPAFINCVCVCVCVQVLWSGAVGDDQLWQFASSWT